MHTPRPFPLFPEPVKPHLKAYSIQTADWRTEVLPLIRQKCADGKDFETIAQELRQEGVKRFNTGTEWTAGNISDLLRRCSIPDYYVIDTSTPIQETNQ